MKRNLQAIGVVALKEWKVFFDSVLGYLVLVLFLAVSGTFTWLIGNDVFTVGQATLQPFFIVAYWTLFFFVPALTMRAFAEEKRTGTLEWLFTQPVSDTVILLGKYLAVLGLILLALVLTLPYYFTLISISEHGWKGVDHGAIFCGYLGLLLMSAVYAALGLFASSLTQNQVVAFLTAIALGIFFHLVAGIGAGVTSGWVQDILSWLDMSRHFQAMARGVLDIRDVGYFVSLSLLGLFATESILVRRLIQDPAPTN